MLTCIEPPASTDSLLHKRNDFQKIMNSKRKDLEDAYQVKIVFFRNKLAKIGGRKCVVELVRNPNFSKKPYISKKNRFITVFFHKKQPQAKKPEVFFILNPCYFERPTLLPYWP